MKKSTPPCEKKDEVTQSNASLDDDARQCDMPETRAEGVQARGLRLRIVKRIVKYWEGDRKIVQIEDWSE